jgi:N1-aminopropylagmatine ureohydrolase
MNFGGHEVVYEYSSAEIVIIPVPYDETSTWQKGADKGPEALMKASVNLEWYDIETGTDVSGKGIFTADPVSEKGSPQKLVNAVYSSVKKALNDQKFPVIVGGNHTVSIGSVRAFAEKWNDLSVLQLDAHSDLRQEYEGSSLNHACSMARVREIVPLVQVGIRSMASEELPLVDRSRIFYAYELHSDKALYRAEKLTGNVYITIDLDVFDPSLMPSTGTPEPGGPEYFDLMNFLHHVIKTRNVVGFDVVELCPSEVNKAPDFVAAKIIYQLLSYKFA